MPLLKQQLIDLLAKTEATIDETIALPPELKTKARVHFVCKCGEKHSNEIRGIKQRGAFCATCMANKKSSKISEAKTQPKELPTQFDKLCKGCGHYRDLSHFENANKNHYTELCKKCRKKTLDSRKRTLEKMETVKVKEGNQLCYHCRTEKPKAEFINSGTGHPTKRCSDCRKVNTEREKNRKDELKTIKPNDDEQKCERCFMNRKKKEFKKSTTICDICVNQSEKNVENTQKQRRIDKINTFAETYNEKLCNVCDEYLPLSKFTGTTSICDECGYTCELCFNNKKKSEFIQSETKCIECITKQTKTIVNERYKNEKLYCELNYVYDYTTLEKIIIESNATNMKVLDIPLNKNSTISFKCECGNDAKFNYVYLKKNNRAACGDCMK